MPIKAGWRDASLTLRDFSRRKKHCIHLSTTRTIYFSCFVVAMSVFQKQLPESCSVKKVFLKLSQNLQENTHVRVSFWKKLQAWGLVFSCESCEILKNTFFFTEHLQRLLLAFARIEIPYSNTECNKSAAEAWICLVSFYGAKDFIFTCIFLRKISFFINM